MRKSNRRGKGNWLVRTLAVAAAAFLILISAQEKLGLGLGLPRISELSEFLRGLTSSRSESVSGGEPGAEVKVHFIDVEQGKAILIEAPEKNVLIDAGEREQGPVVLGYLNETGVRRIDLLIASHPHSDHIGGLSDVISQVTVGMVVTPVVSDEMVPASSVYRELLETIDEQGLRITPSRPGDEYDLGGGSVLTLLGPLGDYDDLNDYSVVSRLDFGANSFLFTGDATTSPEDDLLEAGAGLDATVLDVGHHGSYTSTGEDFLRAVSPRVAVISCAVDNSYGHPHREVIERLEESGAEIFRTDLDGHVVIASDGADLEIEVEK